MRELLGAGHYDSMPWRENHIETRHEEILVGLVAKLAIQFSPRGRQLFPAIHMHDVRRKPGLVKQSEHFALTDSVCIKARTRPGGRLP